MCIRDRLNSDRPRLDNATLMGTRLQDIKAFKVPKVAWPTIELGSQSNYTVKNKSQQVTIEVQLKNKKFR
eukprot:11541814-Alexandrium_andersonii.AAC.1